MLLYRIQVVKFADVVLVELHRGRGRKGCGRHAPQPHTLDSAAGVLPCSGLRPRWRRSGTAAGKSAGQWLRLL